MATLYPPELNETLRADPARRAECLVYDQLSALPDDYHVFYSVRWQAASRRGVQRDGEADFVVAHADRGVLVIEVKGGRVEYRGHADGWVSLDAAGRVRPGSRDPVAQARESCHALYGALCGRRGWRHGPFCSGYAVALPDLRVPANQPLPPSTPRALLLDGDSVRDPRGAVEAVFDHWLDADGPSLGADRLGVLVELLDGWVRLPWRPDHDHVARRLVELTDQQFFVLDMLRDQPRALIGGCAGSGKTLLAAEKARRLAEAGQRVLLTCFNRPLGVCLADMAAPGVTATNFHRLCVDLATAAGLPSDSDGPADQTYFDQTLPRRLIAAARALDLRYDALIVDEAQDFRESHWQALAQLLADPRASSVYVFYDSNQNLFRSGTAGWPAAFGQLIDQLPLEISRNCRTTRTIHRVAMAFHQGSTPDCQGPEGGPVRVVEAAGPEQTAAAVAEQVRRLTHDEGVPPESVVLLTGHTPEPDSPWAVGRTVAGLRVTADDPPRPGELLVSTVQRFKGLERRAVVVADLDATVQPALETVLYVGCSRAIEHLAVIIDSQAPAATRERLRAVAAEV